MSIVNSMYQIIEKAIVFRKGRMIKIFYRFSFSLKCRKYKRSIINRQRRSSIEANVKKRKRKKRTHYTNGTIKCVNILMLIPTELVYLLLWLVAKNAAAIIRK